MLRIRVRAAIGLFVATVMLLKTSGAAWAQQYYGNRGFLGRCGGAIRNGYRGPYAAGTGNRAWSGPPHRFYDSTGRWTGDGVVDPMSTAKPIWQPVANPQPSADLR